MKTEDIVIRAKEYEEAGKLELSVPLRCEPPSKNKDETLKKAVRVVEALEKRGWNIVSYKLHFNKKEDYWAGIAHFARINLGVVS